MDLKSAHLFIAAWLWDAQGALETLTRKGYCIWDDLMEHCRQLFEKQGLEVPEKGDPLYDDVKEGMKIMVYSTVYGMPAPSIQAQVTKALKSILGPKVGDKLTSHPVISEIRQCRDEKLRELGPGDTLETPTGIEIEVEVSLEDEGEKEHRDKVGPKSAMSTLAQAYEQELMSVLIDVAEEREHFRLLLWLHDGAACNARRPNGLENAVNEALRQKQEELTEFAGKDTLLPAIFEVEEIDAPDMPPEDIHDRIATAGGGVVRLKENERAVKVHPEHGQEIENEVGPLLLKRDHELYRIADTYIRVTRDGYEVTSDPYPQELLWNSKECNSTSSTSQKTDSQKRPAEEENLNNGTEANRPTKTAPGVASPSRAEESSPASDTSTSGVPRPSEDRPSTAADRAPKRPREDTDLDDLHPKPEQATEEQKRRWAAVKRGDKPVREFPGTDAYKRRYGHYGSSSET